LPILCPPFFFYGTAQPPPWVRPFHTLVRLDSGELLWFLTEILTVGEAPIPEPRKRASKKEVKVKVKV